MQAQRVQRAIARQLHDRVEQTFGTPVREVSAASRLVVDDANLGRAISVDARIGEAIDAKPFRRGSIEKPGGVSCATCHRDGKLVIRPREQ